MYRTTVARALLVALSMVSSASCLASDLAASSAANVVDARLSSTDGTLTLEPIQIPYYVGEELILRVTVKNESKKQRHLLAPTDLLVDRLRYDEPEWLRTAFHRCQPGPTAGHRDIGREECELRLKEKLVIYQPSEARSAVWVARPSARELHSTDSTSVGVYGIGFSSHGLSGDALVSFKLHRLPRSVTPRVLTSPFDGVSRLYLIAPAGPTKFLVLSVGRWLSKDTLPRKLDGPSLDGLSDTYGLVRYAVVESTEIDLSLDDSGQLKINKEPALRPLNFVGTGWVAPE